MRSRTCCPAAGNPLQPDRHRRSGYAGASIAAGPYGTIIDAYDKTPAPQLPRYDWVIAHAWSYFKKAPGSDENAEDMAQENAPAQGGVRGYSPVTWCAERLPGGIRVVSPEELAWRIRMKHDPAATQKLISQFQ